VQAEELSPRMGKAGRLDAGAAVARVREQGFVTGIVVSAKDGANAANAGAICRRPSGDLSTRLKTGGHVRRPGLSGSRRRSAAARPPPGRCCGKPKDRLFGFCRCRGQVAPPAGQKNAPAFSALPTSLWVVGL